MLFPLIFCVSLSLCDENCFKISFWENHSANINELKCLKSDTIIVNQGIIDLPEAYQGKKYEFNIYNKLASNESSHTYCA